MCKFRNKIVIKLKLIIHKEIIDLLVLVYFDIPQFILNKFYKKSCIWNVSIKKYYVKAVCLSPDFLKKLEKSNSVPLFLWATVQFIPTQYLKKLIVWKLDTLQLKDDV